MSDRFSYAFRQVILSALSRRVLAVLFQPGLALLDRDIEMKAKPLSKEEFDKTTAWLTNLALLKKEKRGRLGEMSVTYYSLAPRGFEIAEVLLEVGATGRLKHDTSEEVRRAWRFLSPADPAIAQALREIGTAGRLPADASPELKQALRSFCRGEI